MSEMKPGPQPARELIYAAIGGKDFARELPAVRRRLEKAGHTVIDMLVTECPVPLGRQFMAIFRVASV